MILGVSAGEVIVWIVWVVAALALLGSGFAVILFSNPFYSALALILNLGSLAVLYLLLSAEFVAAAQVLVYAGAVMVMFLFVIASEASGTLSTAADLTGALGAFGTPAEIGRLFLSDSLLAFEITSIILLVGAVGGVVLGSGAKRGADELPEEASQRGAEIGASPPEAA